MPTKTRQRACRSKKHTFGGCGDPRCPEGLHLGTLLQRALNEGNLDGVFDAVERARLRPTFAYVPDDESQGYMELGVYEPVSKRDVKVHVRPERQGLREQLAKLDNTSTPELPNAQAINDYAKERYLGEVTFHLRENLAGDWQPWGEVHVGQITVPADLRGLGIAAHLKRAVTAYADRNNLFVSGTPTNRGDGATTPETDPEHTAKAIHHRARLTNAYYRHGYVDNPCWQSMYRDGDWLTKDFQVTDHVAIDAFTERAAEWLNRQGQFIRFPNGQVPADMLKPGRTFDATGYRAPAAQATREAAEAMSTASYDAMFRASRRR